MYMKSIICKAIVKIFILTRFVGICVYVTGDI